MKKQVRNSLYLIALLSIFVLGISFIAVGVKNLSESEEITRLIEPSQVYKTDGFASIEEWKAEFEDTNQRRVFIGLVLLGVVAGIALLRKSKGSD